MAGNTRGKLKENLEGVHRNCDWIRVHCLQSLALIEDHHPQLSAGVAGLGKMAELMDDTAQKLYALI